MFINFDNLPRGEKIQGGLTALRIIATAIKLKVLSLIYKGYKPVHCRPTKEKGWFIRKGYGGKSGEALVRLNFGTWYSNFQAYNRNGKSRYIQTTYVPFKAKLVQTKI